MRNKFLISLLTVLLVPVIWQWDLVSYGIRQGQGQLSIVWNARPLEEYLRDSNYPDSLKLKIMQVLEARRFAFEELGLTESDNYTTLYQQDEGVSLWNLSASEPFSLTPKTWWFPIVGAVPYKGFFDLDKAKKEREVLDREGFDTQIRPVSGWSTLGWFQDPVLSSMLERSEGQLYELIIHELTHGTVFVRDEVEFNENLASFIGEKGAILLLLKLHGENSGPLNEYLNGETDSERFREHILRGTQYMDSLYIVIAEIESIEKKNQLKLEGIQRIVDKLDTIDFYNSRYHEIFGESLPNNAYFMSYRRYHSAEDSLLNLLSVQYANDLPRFIQGMIEAHAK